MTTTVVIFVSILLVSTAVAQWSGIVIDGASEPTSQVFAPMGKGNMSNFAWQLNAGLPHRVGAVAVNYEGQIYIIGGCCDAFGFASSQMVIFDPLTNTTTKGAPLLHARSHAAVAISNESIFVCGGKNGATVLSTCERYQRKRWFPVHLTLPEGVAHAQMIAADERLYVFGGISANNAVSSCVLSSNSQATESWQHLSHMPMPLTGHAVIMLNSTTIMVCGGRSTKTTTNAHKYCWFYAIQINAWRNIDDLHLPRGRYGHQIVRYLDRLWCIGGSRSDESNTRKVQVFDEAGGWLDYEDELAVGGESMAIAVVDPDTVRREVVLPVFNSERVTMNTMAVRRAPARFRVPSQNERF